MADRACQPTSFGSDGFDQLLDDVAPTLLDFLDALDTKADALPAPRHSLPSVEVKEEASSSAAAAKDKPKTKSNTWRQRQRLEVLRLRDEVKQLDAELKKRKLAAGVRSTLPPVSSVGAALAIKRPAARKLLNESWRDAASRESLARQMADVENERLHKVMRMQVKHARKLYRMMTQQMTTAVVAQALGCRPGLTGDECYPPSDNNAVFRKLLAELDDHGGSMNSIFVTSGFYGGSGSRKDNSQVTINRTRGLQVQVVSRYTVPFTVEATERAVWEVLTRINEKESRVAYSELFEVDNSTTLQSIHMFTVIGQVELCFLVRKGCRKYTEAGQTFFVTHETAVVKTSFGGGVSYDEMLWRSVKQGKEAAGVPTAIIITHILATFPSYKTLDCLPPEGLNGFHDSMMRFNHEVEDVLIKKLTK